MRCEMCGRAETIDLGLSTLPFGGTVHRWWCPECGCLIAAILGRSDTTVLGPVWHGRLRQGKLEPSEN